MSSRSLLFFDLEVGFSDALVLSLFLLSFTNPILPLIKTDKERDETKKVKNIFKLIDYFQDFTINLIHFVIPANSNTFPIGGECVTCHGSKITN